MKEEEILDYWSGKGSMEREELFMYLSTGDTVSEESLMRTPITRLYSDNLGGVLGAQRGYSKALVHMARVASP